MDFGWSILVPTAGKCTKMMREVRENERVALAWDGLIIDVS
jgi:hypothetical protein